MKEDVSISLFQCLAHNECLMNGGWWNGRIDYVERSNRKTGDWTEGIMKVNGGIIDFNIGIIKHELGVNFLPC